MIGVEVKIKGDKELDAKLGRFRGKKAGLRIAKAIAEDIKTAAQGLVPVWHGNLQKSIKVVPHENGYSLEMNFYGRFVDRGTMAHAVSANNYLFRAWALSHNVPWAAVMSSVAVHGTKAHPFIQRSIDYGVGRMDGTAITVLNKTLKESGFDQR